MQFPTDPIRTLRPRRSFVAALLASMLLLTAAHASAESPFLILDGHAHGEQDSTTFPNQSFDAALEGLFVVTSIGKNLVRITGSYHYATEIQIWWTSPYGAGLFFPYPIEVEASVDLVARVRLDGGTIVYDSPEGQISTQTHLPFWPTTVPRVERRRLPDLRVRPASGFRPSTWAADGPLVDVEDETGFVELFFEGTAPAF